MSSITININKEDIEKMWDIKFTDEHDDEQMNSEEEEEDEEDDGLQDQTMMNKNYEVKKN